MTHEQLILEHSRLVDLLFVRGHLTGSEKRRLLRIRRKLDRPHPRPVPVPVPTREPTIEPYFRLESVDEDGTVIESVEAQTKEQGEAAFFRAVGLLMRLCKTEEPRKP